MKQIHDGLPPDQAADTSPPAGRSGVRTTLRQGSEERAQENVCGLPDQSAVMSPEESRRALFELRVHQIELEMQNEQLRTSEDALRDNQERLDLALVSSRMATFDFDIASNHRTWSDGVHVLL